MTSLAELTENALLRAEVSRLRARLKDSRLKLKTLAHSVRDAMDGMDPEGAPYEILVNGYWTAALPKPQRKKR